MNLDTGFTVFHYPGGISSAIALIACRPSHFLEIA
jgi:hypothetical protein